jgi:predicted MFS family arabinose efflux permease
MSDSSGGRRKLLLMVLAVACFGAVGGLYETTFNNYLKEVYDISAQARSRLEFPREMPGFLVTVVAGSLVSLALNRVGYVAMALAAVGLVGMAFAPERFAVMAVFMVIYSTGVHLNMPTTDSLTLALSSKGRQATRLGQMGAAGIVGTIVGAGFVALAMRAGLVSFKGVYLVAACVALGAAAILASMGRVERKGQPRRKVFVLKRRYALYYVLCALYGARKQVFMTFGPWVIIKVFNQEAYTIANLWLVYSVLGLGVRPLVGHMIDRWGERFALGLEGTILAAVCVTYAAAGGSPSSTAALYAVMAAYVVDQMCFAISMARTTYLSKIIETPEDLPAGLASGVSIDHLVSMSVPLLGGYVWAVWGFEYVFLGAAVVALAYAATSRLVKVPRHQEAPPG